MSASLRVPHLRVVSDRTFGELSDPALTDALLRREPWAAESVWQRYSPLVFSLMRNCLGFRSDAEELTQQTFLRLFARVEVLEVPRALKSVLYSGAVQLLRGQLWRRRLRAVVGCGRPSASPEDVMGIADSRAREAICTFYDTLDALSATDRILLILRQIEGLSAVEIAEVMGWPLSKVQRRVARAVRRVHVSFIEDAWLTPRVHSDRPSDQGLQPEGA